MSKERLIETFKKLVAIDSESKNEGAFHEYLKLEFHGMGLEITEDNSMHHTGLGGNNLIVRYNGQTTQEPLLFSCHTDTVSPGVGIEVIEDGDILKSNGTTILGADDKAGIAIMIEALRRIQEEKIETGMVEFVLTPGEEIGLIGAAAMDMSLIKSNYGYVLDCDGTVGNVIVASPFMFMYQVTIKGKAAHAGVEPEKGISAVRILSDALVHIETGRLDAETTANIGKIVGGTASNIVMDELVVNGEVRAIDKERGLTLIETMKKSFQDAATKSGGEVEIKVDQMATGFRIEEDQPVFQLLEESAKAIKIPIQAMISGGGSDANIFNAKGKSVVNLAIGYEAMHTTSEYVVISEMLRGVDLVLSLIQHAPKKE